MVDKCLQGPPQLDISVQQLCSSTQPKISQGQNIEVQLNSKGDPPEESTPHNPEIYQLMSLKAEYKQEGCIMGEQGFDQPGIVEKIIVRSVETNEILNEDEVQSMSSGVSRTTAEAWFNRLNVNVQKYNNPEHDGVFPHKLPLFLSPWNHISWS